MVVGFTTTCASSYILYYYGKKKAREPVAHVHAIPSGHVIDVISGHIIFGDVASGDITSGSTTWHHLTCDFGCAEILLMGFELATMRIRKLRNIRSSGAFSPEVASSNVT
jgi:hypothetical protein